jgi:DNA-binding beta-propeller fold protein YncE
VLAGVVLASCAPALGLSQRGHSFAFSFASKGEGAGRLLHPAGVALNEASGDIYVVDSGNNRIERFGPRGEFIAAWGWGVSDGKAEYEVCSSACKAGIAGEDEAQLDAPEAIAIDNSTSPQDPSREDVYVLSDTVAQNNVIEKFSPSGEPLGRLQMKSELPGMLGGITVDPRGGVWVSDLGSAPAELVSFNDAKKNELLEGIPLQLECAETRGLALDATAEAFYVSHQRASLQGECPEVAPSPKAPALIAKLSLSGEVQSEALDYENTSSVAVDLASSAGSPLGAPAKGDVYIDNQTSIAAFSADGSLIQRFGSEQLSAGTGVAIDSSTGDVYVADAKANRVNVFEPERAGPPTVDSLAFQNLSATATRLQAQVDPHGSDTHYYFQYGTADCRATPVLCTDVPAPPGADIGSGFGAQATSALADGLTPGTKYFYRVIAANSQGEAEGSQTLGTFTTLPSATDVLADGRAWELVSPPDKHGALIYPIGGTTENGGPASGVIEAAQDGSGITYAANAPVGEDVFGNRALEATQAISTRGSDGWSTQDIATPTDNAKGLQPGAAQEYRWFSPDLSLSLAQPFGPFRLIGTHLQEPPLVPGMQSEERGLYLRHDSTCRTTPASCYEPLLTPEGDTTKAQFGGELEFDGASPDLRHVIFSSDVALSSTAPSAPGLYEWSAGKPPTEALQLVSVLPGNKKAAPDEPEPQLGDFNPGRSSARNAVSADGSRVFWTAITEEKGAEVTRLYMRDTSTGKTIVLNAAQGVKEPKAEELASEEVHFRTASSDGSRVFFTDTFPLTAESKLRPTEEGEEAPADLYVCEVGQGAEGPECKLKDLTVDPSSNLGESADVIGTLPGASEDGSYVYFLANGVLDSEARAAGATPGHCARPNDKQAAVASATCNLYHEHYDAQSKQWEPPRFIARLSQEDQPDWGGSGSFSLGALTSRVSPSGRYLSFMSREPLTGYNNLDQSAGAHGAHDEEVYLYDAAEGRLVCASCNPSGAQPKGVFDHEASGEGKGLLVDRLGVWKETEGEEHSGERNAVDHWLAGSIPGWTPVEEGTALYQSRYLSDEGRLFFDSPDELVAHAKNGKENVYQYEPEGLGSCHSSPGCVGLISSGESDHESAFLDASESGGDAFFLTNQPLVGSDHDTSFDVYDARVCSEASPCISQPPASPQGCEEAQTCRPLPPSQQVFPGPSGSATFSGAGNQPASQTLHLQTSAKPKPLTRAQKLTKALKTCRARYKKSKRKRVVCERQARRSYGPHKPAKKAKQPTKSGKK